MGVYLSSSIDPQSPNFSSFTEELGKRQSELEQNQAHEELAQYDLDKLKIKTVGYFQLAAAAVLTCIIVYNSLFDSGVTVTTLAIAIPFVLLNSFAGYTAVMLLSKWYWVSIFNQALQLFRFSVGSYYLNYAGLGYINVVLGWGQEFSLVNVGV